MTACALYSSSGGPDSSSGCSGHKRFLAVDQCCYWLFCARTSGFPLPLAAISRKSQIADRQIGGLLAFEKAAGVDAELAKLVHNIGSVARTGVGIGPDEVRISVWAKQR